MKTLSLFALLILAALCAGLAQAQELPLAITSLNPSSAVACGSDFILTVNGTGFYPILPPPPGYPDYRAKVYWGSTPLSTTYVGPTQVTALVPGSLLSSFGTVTIVVTQSGMTSNSVPFTVTQRPVSITSLSRTSADVGSASFTLTVTGTGFLQGMTIRWGSTTLSTTYVSPTQLSATVPSGLLISAGAFAITVGSACGVSNSLTFTVLGFRITSLSQSSTPACGSSFTLTVTGVAFYRDTAYPSLSATVYWNSTPLTTTYVSSTQLTATVPSSLLTSPATASITVRQQGQSSNALAFTVTTGLATITSISPSSAPVGGAGFTLTVNGSGFSQASTVRWNGTNLVTTFVSSIRLTAVVPPTLLGPAGQASITVTSACGTSNAVPFTITGPVITSVQPATAASCSPDMQIIVTGTGFQTGSVVRWDGALLQTTYTSATSLSAIVPAFRLRLPGAVSITVLNPDPATSNSVTFTVTGTTPFVTTLVPSSAYSRSGTLTMTVNGTGFTPSMTVRWGATVLPTTYQSPTQLTATVAANLLDSAGQISVTVANDCSQSSAATFTILPSPVSITSVGPAAAPACGPDLTIRVTGDGFQASSVVHWNGIGLATTYVNYTQLSAVVPAQLLASPTTASITVSNPGGVTSNSVPFTVTAGTPNIGSLSPINMVAGSPTFTLSVFGSGFTSAMFVRWRGTDLRTEFRSSTELAATVPADLIRTEGKYLVTVASPCGESRTLEFEVLPPTAVTVASVNPNTAPGCSNALQITITGTGFVRESEARWNGSPLVTTFSSATQLSAAVPASLLGTSGVARISVQSPGPITTNSVDFTVAEVNPVITAISPSSAAPGAAAFMLRLTGTGFAPGMSVRWGTTNLTTAFVSAEELTVNIPAIPLSSPASIDVQVTNPCGALSNALPFAVTAALGITSVSPASITAGSASLTLTVNGSGFVANSQVRWNATQLNTSFVGPTTLTAQVPAALLISASTAQITVVNPGGQTTASLPFTITSLPVITTLSPAAIDAGSAAFTLTVNGSGYTAGAIVRWDSTPLTTTFVSATRLTAAVTAALLGAPGAPTITVLLPTGAATNAIGFAVNLPALPAMTLTGLPPSCTTAQQHKPQLTLANPYPLAMTGELTLTFKPADGLPGAADFLQNYRQVQFAGGGTRSSFTLPAAGASLDLPMVQTGTVAGTITAAVTQLTCSSTQLTPPSTTVQTIEVLAAAPKITTLEIVRNSTGFEVRIVGDSSIREVTEMTISFTAGAGANLQTTSLTVPLNSVFAAYFTSAASSAYGSTYQLIVPFIIDGQQSAVTSASVVLRNRLGASATVSATF